MAKYARVARTIIRDGEELETGTVVDYSEFQWGEQLVEQGKLDAPLSESDFRHCICGETLADDYWYEYHKERHCDFGIGEMTRDELLGVLDEKFDVEEEDIEGSGSDGYVKVQDIRDRLQEELES